jgi:hypothetical protein
MVTNRIIFFATSVQPNPEEIDYWVDLSDNPYGGSIKYFNGTEWVRLAASGGRSDGGGGAGLFALASSDGVGDSAAYIGSRLTYLPWAE